MRDSQINSLQVAQLPASHDHDMTSAPMLSEAMGMDSRFIHSPRSQQTLANNFSTSTIMGIGELSTTQAKTAHEARTQKKKEKNKRRRERKAQKQRQAQASGGNTIGSAMQNDIGLPNLPKSGWRQHIAGSQERTGKRHRRARQRKRNENTPGVSARIEQTFDQLVITYGIDRAKEIQQEIRAIKAHRQKILFKKASGRENLKVKLTNKCRKDHDIKNKRRKLERGVEDNLDDILAQLGHVNISGPTIVAFDENKAKDKVAMFGAQPKWYKPPVEHDASFLAAFKIGERMPQFSQAKIHRDRPQLAELEVNKLIARIRGINYSDYEDKYINGTPAYSTSPDLKANIQRMLERNKARVLRNRIKAAEQSKGYNDDMLDLLAMTGMMEVDAKEQKAPKPFPTKLKIENGGLSWSEDKKLEDARKTRNEIIFAAQVAASGVNPARFRAVLPQPVGDEEPEDDEMYDEPDDPARHVSVPVNDPRAGRPRHANPVFDVASWDSEAPLVFMKRICDECKRSKQACDKDASGCKRCVNRGKTCVYSRH